MGTNSVVDTKAGDVPWKQKNRSIDKLAEKQIRLLLSD